MYKIEGRIELVAPYLYNKPLEQTQKGKIPEEKWIEDAKRKVHENGHGLIVPTDQFKNSIIRGCLLADLKEGKRSLAQYLEGSMFVDGDLEFGCDTFDDMHKHWGRIPPRTGAMRMIYRPMMNAGRQLAFVLAVFDDNRKPEQIRIAIDTGGLYSGIGSWRPRYGRYRVLEWEVKKETIA